MANGYYNFIVFCKVQKISSYIGKVLKVVHSYLVVSSFNRVLLGLVRKFSTSSMFTGLPKKVYGRFSWITFDRLI